MTQAECPAEFSSNEQLLWLVHDPDGSLEQTEALQRFGNLIVRVPTRIMATGMELHDRNREIVDSLINYIKSNPEGLSVISAWAGMVATEADKADFTKIYEDELSQNPQHNQLIDRFHKTKSPTDRAAVRRNRFLWLSQRLASQSTDQSAA